MAWIDNIQEKVVRRVSELDGNDELCLDLIEQAFYSIMKYSKANAYQREWDPTLVHCVVMLYNNLGAEGSISRSSLDTSDTYDGTDILGSYIQANIPQFIRPTGYRYSEARFEYPNE